MADAVADAKSFVEAASKPNPPWDGPTTGPAIQEGQSIVYVSTDQRNGGARGVGVAVEEAAGSVGWTYRELDGQVPPSGRASALNQAIALQPNVIVLGGIDANEQAAAIEQAAAEGIALVGWHSMPRRARMTACRSSPTSPPTRSMWPAPRRHWPWPRATARRGL